MAFDKGFEVLETVRKYFATPYLIPIVSGDKNLYDEVLKAEFKTKNSYMEDKTLNNLIDQYLTKVFPLEKRIKLENISDILNYSSSCEIIYEKENEKNDVKIKHSDLKKFIEKFFILHHISYYDILPDNVRKFTQQLENIRPFLNNIKDVLNKSQQDNNYPIFKLENYSSFLNALSFANKEAQIYENIFQNSLTVKSEYIYDILNNDFFDHFSKSLKEYKKGFIRREALRKSLFISKDDNKLSTILNGLNPKDRFIFDLFTYHNYYSPGRNSYMLTTGNFVYFILSTLSIKEEDKKKNL